MDNGHSFDEVLFYGSESLLLQFELMLFTVIIGFSGSFLTATVAVGFVYQVRMTLLDPFKYSDTISFPSPAAQIRHRQGGQVQSGEKDADRQSVSHLINCPRAPPL